MVSVFFCLPIYSWVCFLLDNECLIYVFYFALSKTSNEQTDSSIDFSISQAVKDSSKITMTKNYRGSVLL